MNTFKAEIGLKIAQFKRYPTDFLSELFMLVLIFVGIFGSGEIVGNGVNSASFKSLLMSYMLWILIQQTIGNMGGEISYEAQTGTIEQLYTMPTSSEKIFFAKNVVSALSSIVEMIITLIIIMLINSVWINFPLMLLFPLILAFLTIIGVGYLIASIVLLTKQFSNLLQIIEYVYLPILLIKFDYSPLSNTLLEIIVPVHKIANWMTLIINHQNYNFNLYMVISIVDCLLWLMLGLTAFKKANNLAKHSGKIGNF